MSTSRLRIASITLGVLVVGGIAEQVQAAPITFANRATFDAAFPGATTETYEDDAPLTVFPDGTTNDGITYATSGADSAMVINTFLTTTTPNSLGDTSGFFADEAVTFSFGSPQSAFGIDINTFAMTSGGYSATTSAGEVILSVFDPFPGFDTGQFIGFSTTASFTSVTLAPLVAGGFNLDTLRYVAASPPVPEPASMWLLSGGLVGLAARRLRRDKK